MVHPGPTTPRRSEKSYKRRTSLSLLVSFEAIHVFAGSRRSGYSLPLIRAELDVNQNFPKLWKAA